MRRRAVLLAPLWVAALFTGCNTLGPSSDSLKVTVSGIEIIEATLMEQLYRVTLRIQNRTARPLSLSGGSFDLELNGRDFGSGVTNQAVTIDPFSDAQLDVRMVSTAFGIVRLIQGLQDRQGDPLSYRISGRFSTGGLFGLSFSESGEIALPRTEQRADALTPGRRHTR